MYVADDYTITDKAVLLRGRPLRGADPRTFRHLYSFWSRDAGAVFFQTYRRTKPDPATFEPLNHVWGRDARAAYASSGKPVAGARAAAFRAFDVGLSAVGEAGFDYASFGGFAGDDAAVFYHRATDPGGRRVVGADPATFRSLGHFYGQDATSVFFEHAPVRGAVSRSFHVINETFAADERSVFFAGRKLDGADPRTFMLLWDRIGRAARDRHRYYSGPRVVTREQYAQSLRKDAAGLTAHAAEVESGAFDDQFKELRVDAPP